MAAQRRDQLSRAPTTRTCHECLTEGHAADAAFCFKCGARLPPYQYQESPVDGAATARD
jgi:voltage-gated potassium channel